jgi:hypothetical protein
MIGTTGFIDYQMEAPIVSFLREASGALTILLPQLQHAAGTGEVAHVRIAHLTTAPFSGLMDA